MENVYVVIICVGGGGVFVGGRVKVLIVGGGVWRNTVAASRITRGDTNNLWLGQIENVALQETFSCFTQAAMPRDKEGRLRGGFSGNRRVVWHSVAGEK